MSDKNQNEVLIAQQLNEKDVNNEMNNQINDNQTELLKHQLNALTQEKNNMETNFGYKRAKFKEIMLKKEEEMRMNKEQTNKRIEEYEDQLKHLQKELDENKSLLMVSELQKENEIDYYKQKHNEEIGLMRLSLNEQLGSFRLQHDQEVENLKKVINEKAINDNDVFNLKSLQQQQQPQTKNESMLSVVTKSFKQKVGSLNTTLNTSSLLGSSFDDKQQQLKLVREQEEEFDFLVPLEEETKMLKEKLRNTDKKLNSYEKILKILMSEFGIERICGLINSCSNPDETYETVNKFREEFINKQNLDTSIQLDDKDSILANLLCEQAKLRNENEKLAKKINQLVNSNKINNNLQNDHQKATNEHVKNDIKSKQSIQPNHLKSLNIINRLSRSKSLTLLNELANLDCLTNLDKDPQQIKLMNKDEFYLNSKLVRPCEMCSNYELQLQTLQICESDFMKKIENYDKLLYASKQELMKEQEFRLQIEEKFVQEAKECEKIIDKLQTKLATANYEVSQLKCAFNENRKCFNEKLEELKQLNLRLNFNLKNLRNENARLLGCFVVKSKQLHSEAIDLPQTLEEVQFYCLKIREDLISVSLAKEKLEEDFKSQLMLMKEQQKSDYLTERRFEELSKSLVSENDKLKSQLSSVLKELNNLKCVNDEHELLLKQTSISIQNYEKRINELQNLTTELMTVKVQIEHENSDLKNKIQNLQSDIMTSEAVQKDFVKLSQSLQIELEKIRQADSEVRWQHDDDVTDCGSCKKFLSKKEKTHCSHCGKIFCNECNNKIILGGPLKNRRFKVCVVCHTLLDSTIAPYFSSRVPQNPI